MVVILGVVIWSCLCWVCVLFLDFCFLASSLESVVARFCLLGNSSLVLIAVVSWAAVENVFLGIGR